MTEPFPACRTEVEGLEIVKKPKSSVQAEVLLRRLKRAFAKQS